jgi:hypothetical protein
VGQAVRRPAVRSGDPMTGAPGTPAFGVLGWGDRGPRNARIWGSGVEVTRCADDPILSQGVQFPYGEVFIPAL